MAGKERKQNSMHRRSYKDLIANLTHPPLSDRRFWMVQGLVIMVFVIHLLGDILQDHGAIPVPGFLWLLLLFIPVVYAGTSFGLVGSLAVAILGMLLLGPAELLAPHTSTGIWGEWGILAIVFVIAVLLGDNFESVRILAKEQVALELLKDSEEQFRVAFDGAPIGMALSNQEGQFLRVNSALCQMVGRSTSEVIRLGIWGLTDPADRNITLEALKNSRNQAKVSSITKRYLHTDGHIVLVRITASPFRDSAGNFRYFISQFQDITAEHAAAEALAFQALHDPLTGLANRVLFEDHLSAARGREVIA